MTAASARCSMGMRFVFATVALPTGFPLHLLHVRRYDMDIVPAPDLTLEYGAGKRR